MTGERVDPVVPLDPDRLDAIEADARAGGRWHPTPAEVLALVAAAREVVAERVRRHGAEELLSRARSEAEDLRIAIHGCGCPAPYDMCPHDEPLTSEVKRVRAERDAALASPEGVVTLPKLGQRVRITTDDGMDHVGEVIRYGDPEGNVRTLFMVALDDGSSGYFLDEPSWHWTLVPYRPEDTKGCE